ncbi:glutathione S-transferase N-terminal domain-containing protein [Motiliproteus sp. SC1-56]|uniref:glutathione S-transferase N-terminal domain-containing protein n=1 Tax=Motiliproteus sp. SC1-56 TaxID=2799565 RepID=UPI001A901934|nr:glutathione S-transferase N-terminal domain-containing protein [Motiliproteus sp. SC1-56]
MSARKLYELAGKRDNQVFSPYCWRIRLALAHKGLAVQHASWRFTEKDSIAHSGQGAVPVLEDNGQVIHDSWNIACYLDRVYADRPALFDSPMSKGQALFIKHWLEGVIHPAMIKIVIMDILNCLDEKDQAYFRQSREARFGVSLEAFEDKSPEQLQRLRQALAPVRQTLKLQPFLSGQGVGFADFMLLGAFLWTGSVSDTALLESDDPIAHWREELLKSYAGALEGVLRPGF